MDGFPQVLVKPCLRGGEMFESGPGLAISTKLTEATQHVFIYFIM